MAITETELESLLNDPESDRVERKESFRGDAPDKTRKAVCAFANDLPNHGEPGFVFIGAKDDGSPSRLAVTDELLLLLAAIRSEGSISPFPSMTVEKRVLKGADMAVIKVLPADAPPVRFNGRIWIRTESRRDIASAQDERILNEKRRHKDLPFDVQPVPSASLADLDERLFEDEYLPAIVARDVLEANCRTFEEQLSACRMIESSENPIPTVVGLMVLAPRVRDFIACDYIQFLRIDGATLADPIIDEATIDVP